MLIVYPTPGGVASGTCQQIEQPPGPHYGPQCGEKLSRDLHDGVAQLVAHLLLRLDTIKELVEANRPREAEASASAGATRAARMAG